MHARHQAYCRAAACSRFGDIEGYGYCRRCYRYWQRHGVERPADLNWLGQPGRCRIFSCHRRDPLKRGYCNKHYLAAWRLFGDIWRKESKP